MPRTVEVFSHCRAFILAMMTGFLCDLTAAEVPDLKAIKEAAEESGKIYLPRAAKRKTDFGFEAQDDLSKSKLGAPIQVHRLFEGDLANYKKGAPVTNSLQPAPMWFVPVEMDDRKCAMIEVTRTQEGKFVGSGFGMAPLARQWQNVETWWPVSNNFTPILVMAPPAPGYFFTIPQTTPPNLTALSIIPLKRIEKNAARPELASAERTIPPLLGLLKQIKTQSER